MIQTIEVTIRNGLQDSIIALIVYAKNICYVNNKKYHVSDSFMEEFLQTIYPWQNEYGTDGNIDSEEFIITINSTDGKEIYHGKGVFPHNYQNIKDLLGDIHD